MFEALRLRWKPWIIGCCLAPLLGVLSGCSTFQLGYGQGPALGQWWLSRYAEFTPEQSRQVRAALGDWFSWHRRTQLTRYADDLARLQQLTAQDLTPAQVCQQWAVWQQHAAVAAAQALPAVASIGRTLDAGQLAQIARRQAKVMAEAREELLLPTAAERQEAGYERTLKRAEQFYGRLDEPQRRLLREAVAQLPYDAERSLAGRQARQQAFLALLREGIGPGVGAAAAGAGSVAGASDGAPPGVPIEAGLKRLVADTLVPAEGDEAAYRRRLAEANCSLAARLHNSTSAGQRRELQGRLRGWETDLRALAGR